MDTKDELSLGALLEYYNTLGRVKDKNTNTIESEQSNKKRQNKNRPREESSKIPPKSIKTFTRNTSKRKPSRDPRFDSLCGTYNERFFKEAYSFIDEIKQKEKYELLENLKEENDPERREQIKFLLKRIKDQERENERKNKKKKQIIEQSEKLKKSLLEGKHTHFKTKSEKKLSELVTKYEELKSKGKLQTYIKKKSRKSKKNKEDSSF